MTNACGASAVESKGTWTAIKHTSTSINIKHRIAVPTFVWWIANERLLQLRHCREQRASGERLLKMLIVGDDDIVRKTMSDFLLSAICSTCCATDPWFLWITSLRILSASFLSSAEFRMNHEAIRHRTTILQMRQTNHPSFNQFARKIVYVPRLENDLFAIERRLLANTVLRVESYKEGYRNVCSSLSSIRFVKITPSTRSLKPESEINWTTIALCVVRY